jgi:hypothetical protein
VQPNLLQRFYEATMVALKEAKNERLWFKTNLKVYAVQSPAYHPKSPLALAWQGASRPARMATPDDHHCATARYLSH